MAKSTIIDIEDLHATSLGEKAGQCNCGNTQCSDGCPKEKPIPELNHSLSAIRKLSKFGSFDQFQEAEWERFEKAFTAHEIEQLQDAFRIQARSTPFFGFTGRICPAPCQSACTRRSRKQSSGEYDPPVQIKSIEDDLFFIGQHFGWFDESFYAPDVKTGKQVMVVGSGPAGIEAAYWLRAQGHDVTIFERSSRPGGLLRYGVPDSKLAKPVIDFYFRQMERMGITVAVNAEVHQEDGWFTVTNTKTSEKTVLPVQPDAVILAIGVTDAPRLPRIEGIAGVKGVVQAMDYLTRANEAKYHEEQRLPYENPLDFGKEKVVVVGGGDTGADAIHTAALQISQQQMKSERGGVLHATDRQPLKGTIPPVGNAWPNVPETIDYYRQKSMTSVEAKDHSMVAPVAVRTDADGNLTHVQIEHLKLRFPYMASLPKLQRQMVRDETKGERGTEWIETSKLVLALGFEGVRGNHLIQELGLTCDGQGNLVDVLHNRTKKNAIYVAGDADPVQHPGTVPKAKDWLVVDAQASAARCAESVHRDLSRKKEISWEEARTEASHYSWGKNAAVSLAQSYKHIQVAYDHGASSSVSQPHDLGW